MKISPGKQKEIDEEVARHLERLKKEFEAGILVGEAIRNADVTYSVMNMESGKTFGFSSDNEVKYADVTSG